MSQTMKAKIAVSEKSYYSDNFSIEVFRDRQRKGVFEPIVQKLIYTKQGFTGSPNITSSIEIGYKTGFQCTPDISVILITSEWIRDNEKANVFKGAILPDAHARTLILEGLLNPVNGYLSALTKMDEILKLEGSNKKAARTFGHYFLPDEKSTGAFRNTIKTLTSIARDWQQDQA
ncbi:MAG: hypothetical protein KGH71_05725 [Candidatus Micrarchaeota archaeon]|nr:hypothetical protein [Candidatus Micrarchaeota archaeon]